MAGDGWLWPLFHPAWDCSETLSGCHKSTAEVEGRENLIVGLRQSVLTLDPAMHRDRVTETVLKNILTVW